MMTDRFSHYKNSEFCYTMHGKTARRISWDGYCQKEIFRHLPRGDRYSLWRRYQNGVETWLCVIWHDNWEKHRKGSDISGSYLREEVEAWVLQTLLNIHHSKDIANIVHQDFETMANDPDFDL